MYQGWDIRQKQWRSVPMDTPGARADMFSAVVDRNVELYNSGPDMRYDNPIYRYWYHTHRTALRMAIKELESGSNDMLIELILNCIARSQRVDFRLLRELPADHMVMQIYFTMHSAQSMCDDLAEVGRFDIVQYLEQHGMPVSFSPYHNEGQLLKDLPSYYPELPEHYIPDNDYGMMAAIRTGVVSSQDGWNVNMLLPVRVAASAIRRGLITKYTVEPALSSASYAKEIYKASREDKDLVLKHLTDDSHPYYRQALEHPTEGKNFYQWFQGVYAIFEERDKYTRSQEPEVPMLASGQLIIVNYGIDVVLSLDDKALPLHYVAKDYPDDVLGAMVLLGNMASYCHAVHEIIKHRPRDEQLTILQKLYD